MLQPQSLKQEDDVFEIAVRDANGRFSFVSFDDLNQTQAEADNKDSVSEQGSEAVAAQEFTKPKATLRTS